MYINPKDTIADISIVLIRDFLNKHGSDPWDLNFISRTLDIPLRRARVIISVLKEKGFIERHEVGRKSDAVECWVMTLKGSSFALASAAKPIKRKTAEKALASFMERVAIVNSSDEYLYYVDEVILFGSYLTDKEYLNDIDIAVKLERKNEETYSEMSKKQVSDALKNGKIFGSYAEELYWPDRKTKLFLKNHSRAISLHTSDDRILDVAEKVTIYNRTLEGNFAENVDKDGE